MRTVDSDVLASRPAALPQAYFITFACYGTHIHGDPSGTVDRNHNAYRGRLVMGDERRFAAARALMRGARVRLGAEQRRLVLDAVIGVCRHQQWPLHAAHVRSTHVHVVAGSQVTPELMLGKLKAYASRALNRAAGRRYKRWSYHGSTVYLWRSGDVHDAVEYVYARQGAPMARYVDAIVWPQFVLEDAGPSEPDP